MGKGEQQPSFLRARLTTIILLAILVILAVVFWLAYKSDWFTKIRRKEEDKGAPKISLYDVGNQPRLEVVDNGTRVVVTL